ncbi:hypothetical protein GCM10010306_002030 [Streptomyces umbrinus]|nr:hypothetical protein GCM10010306_002030 [Streptomyces umbrinus]GHH44669.1 hypothetical protein GCM10018775_32850 [Streptomyces umbrinus]
MVRLSNSARTSRWSEAEECEEREEWEWEGASVASALEVMYDGSFWYGAVLALKFRPWASECRGARPLSFRGAGQ